VQRVLNMAGGGGGHRQPGGQVVGGLPAPAVHGHAGFEAMLCPMFILESQGGGGQAMPEARGVAAKAVLEAPGIAGGAGTRGGSRDGEARWRRGRSSEAWEKVPVLRAGDGAGMAKMRVLLEPAGVSNTSVAVFASRHACPEMSATLFFFFFFFFVPPSASVRRPPPYASRHKRNAQKLQRMRFENVGLFWLAAKPRETSETMLMRRRRQRSEARPRRCLNDLSAGVPQRVCQRVATSSENRRRYTVKPVEWRGTEGAPGHKRSPVSVRRPYAPSWRVGNSATR